MSAARLRFGAVIVATLAFAYFWLLHGYGINLPDEGTLLYKFARAAEGERLYADFHGGYTPGVFYVHSFLQRLSGESIMPGRIALAFVNSAAVAMLFLLVAPSSGPWCGAIAALLYAAFMPVYPGQFASFNIPYPTWYAVAFFVAGLLAGRSYLASVSAAGALLVGLLAGLGFLFKPNVGALQLASGMLLVLSAQSRAGSTLMRVWWWAVWVAVLGAVVGVFGGRLGGLELEVFLMPIVAAGALCAWRAGKTAQAGRETNVVTASLLVVVGFLAITLPWLAYYATQIPLPRLLAEVFFIGTGYASFFYLPHPSVLIHAALLVVAVAVLYALVNLSPRLRSSGLSASRLAFVVIGVACLGALLVMTRRPMIQGFAFSVTSAFESVWAYAVALAAVWLLIGLAFATPDSNSTLLVLAVGASTLYATNYPRADFMHWAWAAPVSIAGAVVVLSKLGEAWGKTGNGGSAYARAVLLAPLATIGSVFVAEALVSTYHLDGVIPARRASIHLASQRAPVWMNIGRAESYRDLEGVVTALDLVSRPGERVFTFPALDVISFLADRDSPLPDSYFFPRWIDHDDEAAAVALMAARPPRFAVVLQESWPYFDQAPAYYALLADFLDRDYRPYVRVGPFAILAHRDVTEPPPPDLDVSPDTPDARLEAYLRARLDGRSADELPAVLRDLGRDAIHGCYPRLVGLLADDSARVRSETVHALADAGGDRTAAALFNAAEDGRLHASPRALAFRLAGAWAGQETAAAALPFVTADDSDVRNASRCAVGTYADRRVEASFWPGFHGSAEPPWRFDDQESARIREWLRDPRADPRLKTFAIAVARESGGIGDLIEDLAAACRDAGNAPAATEATNSGSAASTESCEERAGAALASVAEDLSLRLQLLGLIDRELAENRNPAAARAAADAALRLLAYDDLVAPRVAGSLLRRVPDPARSVDAVAREGITEAHRERLEYVRSVLRARGTLAR